MNAKQAAAIARAARSNISASPAAARRRWPAPVPAPPRPVGCEIPQTAASRPPHARAEARARSGNVRARLRAEMLCSGRTAARTRRRSDARRAPSRVGRPARPAVRLAAARAATRSRCGRTPWRLSGDGLRNPRPLDSVAIMRNERARILRFPRETSSDCPPGQKRCRRRGPHRRRAAESASVRSLARSRIVHAERSAPIPAIAAPTTHDASGGVSPTSPDTSGTMLATKYGRPAMRGCGERNSPLPAEGECCLVMALTLRRPR